MKKILILETSAIRGGGMGGSYLQAKYYQDFLKKSGYDAKIFYGSQTDGSLETKLKVIDRIKRTDIVIGFGTSYLCSFVQWLCFFLGKRGVFCIDTYISARDIISDHIRKRAFPWKIFILTTIASFWSKIFTYILLPPRLNLINLASCKYVKEKLKYSGLNPKDSKILYPRIKLARETKITKGKKTVLFYGALFRGRGIFDLLKACRLLWKKNIDFELRIYGWPIDPLTKRTLEREIDKYKDKKIILSVDKESNISNIVRDSTIVVIPFRYPCSFQPPYTLFEPMSLRIPVITTDVGSNCELIKDLETGLICRKNDIEDIAEKIERLFIDKHLVKTITNNAYDLLEKKYKEKDVIWENIKKL